MKSSVATATVVVMLALAGCAGEGTVTEAPAIDGAQESDAEAAEPSETDSAEDEPTEADQLDEPTEDDLVGLDPDLAEEFEQVGADANSASFGETVTWDDGISLSVSQPEPYEPSAAAAGSEGYDEAVKFTVTVSNDTDEELSLLFLFATVRSADAEGSQIFDYGGGLEFSFEDVAPGEEVEVDQAHAVDDADDVVVTISPDLVYQDVEFS